MEPMRIGLLAMPWRNLVVPSHHLALLESLVRGAGGAATSLLLHLDVAAEWGLDRYQAWYHRLRHSPLAQEALYAGLLFPERRAIIDRSLADLGLAPDGPDFWPDWATAHDRAFARHDWSAFDAVVIWSQGVVSAPTSQYLAGIEAARRIRQATPDLAVFLAGPAYAGDIGASLLPMLPWIDGVIDGEPEEAVRLLVAADSAKPRAIPGIRWRPETGLPFTPGRPVDLTTLPLPDYASHFAHPLAAELPEPMLRVEAARGCWWDRSAKDLRLSCQFCNINLLSPGYRRKPLAAVVGEIAALAAAYPTRRFGFTDTITWPQEAADLFAAIGDLGLDLSFHGLEAHVSLDRQALWQMRRAGVCSLQFGIESLSPALLKRMGKGIGYDRLVAVLRQCAELGIDTRGNLLLDYPGATSDDVQATLARLAELTWLTPFDLSQTTVGYGSPLHRSPAKNGIARLFPAPIYADLLPADWAATLVPMHYAFDPVEPMPDWTPVRDAVERWRQRWTGSPVALRRLYVDRPPSRPDDLALLAYGGDGRPGVSWLSGKERRLFLYCLEGRKLAAIGQVFGQADWVAPTLERWCLTGHMSRQDEVYLSLGMAADEAGRARLAQVLAANQPSTRPTGPAPRLHLRPNTGRP